MNILLALYICIFAAVVPTAIYVLVFYWADRYEREPGWLVAMAFLWGAIPAVIASVVGELILGIPLAGNAHMLSAELVESAFLAPVVEAETGALACASTRVKVTRVGDQDGRLVLLAGALHEAPNEGHR